MSQNVNLKTAVIGAGFIAEYHINGLRAAGAAEVVALVGLERQKAEERAAQFGIARVETDYAPILADPSIDAVVVATPDATHRDIAIAALEAGKAVLLQKPMALSSTECRDILTAAARSGGRLSVSFMHRHFPEVRWLKKLLDTGELGAINTVRIRNATPGADWADWFYVPGNVSGGVVMQLGVHGIDLCQHLFGPIEKVFAQGRTARPLRTLADGRTLESRLEDNVIASYRLASGTLVTHEMSYTETAGCDRFRLEVYAERGTVWLRTGHGAAAMCAPALSGRNEWVAPAFPEEPFGAHHHAHWVATATRTAPADDTAEAGLSSILVAEATYRSIREGCLIPVGGAA